MSKVDELVLKLQRGEDVTPEQLTEARAADDLEHLKTEAEAVRAEAQAERERDEQRERTMGEFLETAAQGNKRLAAYEKLRREANAAMKKYGEQLLTEKARIRAERQKAIALARTLAPGVFSLTLTGRRENEGELQAEVDALFAELERRGADLTAIGIDWLGGRSLLDRSYSIPRLEYGEVIELAERITARRLEAEERSAGEEAA
jgi:dihydroxyacetone kinase